MFIHLGKPLYGYTLKNGIRINFGYFPGSAVEFKDEEEEGSSEGEEIKYARKRSNIINIIYHALLILILFSIALILGYDPIRICKYISVKAFELITKKIDYNQLIPVVSENYGMYGRILFLCFTVLLMMIFSWGLNLISSFGKYLGFISVAVLVLLYFICDLTYFMFPLSFYIDILLAMTLSGFIFFPLLRFFIK
ncbi:hypothetical protein [uncultured Chryseobacterium sp.]|uniref:hypothetical protein n=1 Tax=uncultured Chryseobacterium sp. TaxID=259322 RepID=UPI0025E2CDBD|nr:hypothetical protein [uncultured Chryseobacterium sp.]